MGLKESGLRGSLRNVSVGIDAIPDSDVYLHDDFGDNRLTDREDSGETTHNGETGVYRPEWDIIQTDGDDPQASNERLIVGTGRDSGALAADLSLNEDETITWEFTDIELGDRGGSGNSEINLIAEQNDPQPDDRIELGIFTDSIGLRKYENGSSSFIIDSEDNDDENIDVEVVREPNGDWELLVNESTLGTGTDSFLPDVNYLTLFADEDGTELSVDEIKVR